MARGFSTPIWGPPLWRILHTLGSQMSTKTKTQPWLHPTSASIATVRKIATWLQTLCSILPCSFCRDSYTQFLTVLATNGPLDQVITNGNLFKWSYDLHELINDKLDTQHVTKTIVPLFTQANCPSAVETELFQNKAYRGRRITFECVQKRYAITPVSFSVHDVWTVLAIFALNYSDNPNKDPESIKKVHDFIIFVSLFPTILNECGMPELAAYLLSIPLNDSDLVSVASIFAWIVRLWLPDASESTISLEMQRYQLAQASACLDGSCI